jgi:hypothetical protein
MNIQASQYSNMSTDVLERKYKQAMDRSNRATTMEATLSDFAVMQAIAEVLASRGVALPPS